MNHKDALELFTLLQVHVDMNYNSEYSNRRQTVQTIEYTTRLYPKAVMWFWLFIMIASSFTILSSHAKGLERIGAAYSEPRIVINTLSMLIFLAIANFIIIGLPQMALNSMTTINPNSRLTIYSWRIFRYFYIPLCAFLILRVILILFSETPPVSHITPLDAAAYLIAGNIIPLGIASILSTFIIPMIPNFLRSVNLAVIRAELDEYTFDYDSIVSSVVKQSYKLVENTDLIYAGWLSGMAKLKSDNITSQLQAFSSLFGVTGLIGLIAIIFSQEQITFMINQGEGIISKFFEVPSSGWLIILFSFTLIGIVFIGVRYFIRLLHAIRILHIVQVICDTRILDIQKQDEDRTLLQSLLGQL